MLFNSFDFLFFFPIVTFLFFILPHALRKYFLLAASAIFYCYFIPIYLLLLIFIILVDYFAALQIEKSILHKKKWLYCSLIANIGVLAIFKYYNFFIANFNAAFHIDLYLLKLILPIGLSFHTFQAMAYTIDVYKEKLKPERDIFTYALYVLFYPQLVAGPIERPLNLLPQLNTKQKFSAQNLLDGLRLMLWGFFKKLVIADNLSLIVDAVYKSPLEYHWYIVLLSIFLFSIQIYCDFSGYTDIARGCARVLGIDLMINFNKPLLSKNIREFWQRWHISLSTWFRDYVYIEMGGNKKGLLIQVFLIMVVFILSGFWHGAGWNFIIWGTLHAFFLIAHIIFFGKENDSKIKSFNKYLVKIFKIIALNFLVAYSFIFFRNESLINAKNIIYQSLNFKQTNSNVDQLLNLPIMGFTKFSLIVGLTTLLFLYESKLKPNLIEMNKYAVLDACWFCFIFFCIMFFGVFTNETFIYFQF
jgi:alginate O-acetyltransferase complex protein AlgI